MVDVRASRAADDAVRTAKPSQPKRIVLPAWIALALFLVVDSSGRAGAADASDSTSRTCLDEGEFAFLRRLSSYDLRELGELVGVHARTHPLPEEWGPAEWDSVVIESVRCLPEDGLSLVQEALGELGYEDESTALARNAVDLDDTPESERAVTSRLAQEALDAESLQVPLSCWDGQLGPQVFFFDPAVHLDPADATRHGTHRAGSLSVWDFESRHISLRPAICFPPNTALPRDGRGCHVSFTHTHGQSDADVEKWQAGLGHADSGQRVCSILGDAGGGLRVESASVHSILGRRGDGGRDPDRQLVYALCDAVSLQDYPPGTQWANFNLTCPYLGGYTHNAELNMIVHWREQRWTQAAVAWGDGTSRAVVGEDAEFFVQMVTRRGENASAGGDFLTGVLLGPAVANCAVQDLGIYLSIYDSLSLSLYLSIYLYIYI